MNFILALFHAIPHHLSAVDCLLKGIKCPQNTLKLQADLGDTADGYKYGYCHIIVHIVLHFGHNDISI